MVNSEKATTYAKALREAAAAEKSLIGNLLTKEDSFSAALLGRANRVEDALKLIESSYA